MSPLPVCAGAVGRCLRLRRRIAEVAGGGDGGWRGVLDCRWGGGCWGPAAAVPSPRACEVEPYGRVALCGTSTRRAEPQTESGPGGGSKRDRRDPYTFCAARAKCTGTSVRSNLVRQQIGYRETGCLTQIFQWTPCLAERLAGSSETQIQVGSHWQGGKTRRLGPPART